MSNATVKISVVMILGLAGLVAAQTPVGSPTPVTVDNFARAESDMYLAAIYKRGGLGVFHHEREPSPIDTQDVIRTNRDTLYSSGLFDLDAGPVTVTLPDAGTRFRSLQLINQDHFVPAVVYGAGLHTFDKSNIGTRYVVMAVRTLVDPNDPRDVQAVHALQDAIVVRQASKGRFEVPQWDQASQRKVRDALLVLATTIPDFTGAFGRKEDVDPIRHLIGTAAGWGGNPARDATYLNVTPSRNDGKTIYTLSVKDVPVDAFWSISVYNAKGFFEKNALNAYTLNNITAKKALDGAINVQFGGCDGTIPNCIPVTPGWNYTVRLYRPRTPILDGTWTFPQSQPVP